MTFSRIIRAAGAGTLLLAAALLAPAGAHAQLGSCRSDPVITLSDLRVLDMSATIGDSASDVKSVKYVLHGPTGVGIIAVLKTSIFASYVESFQYIADQPAYTYVMDTTVTTGTSKVSVTASTTLVSVLTNKTLYVANANGYSGSTVAMPFHDKPLL
jgi:hypothetical protein